MELSQIAVRAAATYLFLLLLTRLSGKHAIAESSAHELVLATVLGDMIDDFLWAEVGADKFVVGTSTLVLLQLLLGMATYAHAGFDRLVNGSPSRMLEGGVMIPAALRFERMTEKDLAALVRHHGLQRDKWHEVKHAWLERSGSLSLLKWPWARTATRRDLAKK